MGDQVPQDTDLKNPDVQSPSKEERGESSLQTEAADATQTTGVSENLDTAESHAKSDSVSNYYDLGLSNFLPSINTYLIAAPKLS